MKFHFIHTNFNVLDLKKSMDFYEKALGLKEVRRIDGDGFTIVYLGDGVTDFQLELTWLHDRAEPYDLGEQEFAPTISRRPARSTAKWAASATKIRPWAFTSSRTPTGIGSKSCPRADKFFGAPSEPS